MLDIDIESHVAELEMLLASAARDALEEVGEQAEKFAKEKCPVDTGNLRNSITHVLDGDDMLIGTNCEYAVYVELGTGAANVPGGTTKASWFYEDATGVGHVAHPMKPRPYLKPAATDHVRTYQNILKNALKNA